MDEEGVVNDRVALNAVGENYCSMTDAIGEDAVVVAVWEVVLHNGVNFHACGGVADGQV